MTNERPILFSGAMVRAILDGRKTQTRRVVKPQPPAHTRVVDTYHYPGERDRFYASDSGSLLDGWTQHCPHGQPGDRLWVRETHQFRGANYGDSGGEIEWFRVYGNGGAGDNWDPDFPAGFEPSRHDGVRKLTEPGEQEGDGVVGYVTKRRPGIHMPRWASRIQLEVTGVRVERLNDCSEADAIAEGIAPELDGWTDYSNPSCQMCTNPIDSYRSLWDSINGAGAWETNPWVWVVEFRRVQP
ncbi:hypothetical protein [Cupriavidus sp.]|uniref:hypothetical protein n=1 Tax=Cupriavidus sp. TaxID=1873897 RepID=UPI003D100EE1